MEIIEKQIEKVKEVPASWCENGCYGPYNNNLVGWGNRAFIPASRGVAGAGLGLGIAGTALGLLALGNRGLGGFGLFGGNASGMPQNININSDSSYPGVSHHVGGTFAPSAFQAWEKGCEDTLALQKGLYEWALTQQSQRFADRQTLDSELFGLYKSQIDADFGLYKSTRDKFDDLRNHQIQDSFSLYKMNRDSFDALNSKVSDLQAQVAVNAAVRPYQDKLIQCEIDKAFTAGINYTNRKTCNALYGEVVLPSTPVVTGYIGATACGCPRVVTTAAAAEGAGA